MNSPNFTYTGQRDISGTGLMDYKARFYSSYLGRFAQADTIIPGGVQGLDRYAYVNNSPLNYTDPTGHKICDDIDGYGQCVTAPNIPGGGSTPVVIDSSNLTSAGQAGYDTYIALFNDPTGWWWSDPTLGGDGEFSIEDFVTLIIWKELAG